MAYSLLALGRTLEPVLAALKLWGDANLGLFATAVAPTSAAA